MTNHEKYEQQQTPQEKNSRSEDLSREIWGSLEKERSGNNNHNPEKGSGGGAEGHLPNCTIEHERSKETTCDEKGACTTKETEKDKITCDMPAPGDGSGAPGEAEQLPGPAEEGDIQERYLEPLNPSPDGSMNRPERVDQVPEANSQKSR